MKLFTGQEILFSMKCYASAMLALYISYSIGLPNPFWAMMTAYVVTTQPWAGSIRSKALYRLGGTVLGSAAAVAIIPNLNQSPALTTFAMTLWLGCCLYVSLLDRTPRSYLFMLAGYTAALIGFPSVNDPVGIFDKGISRVEEISIGILCATLVHSIVLPRGITSVVLAGLDKTLADARAWVSAVLRQAAPEEGKQDRRKLAMDITQLRLTASHIPFDTGRIRWSSHLLRALLNRIISLTPSISSVEDRLIALRAGGQPLSAALQDVLRQIESWIASGKQADAAQLQGLHAAIDRVTPVIQGDAPWQTLLEASLATRLHELVNTYTKCMQLRLDLDAGIQKARGEPAGARMAALHVDRGIALQSAFAAAIAVAICCAFWIITAWPQGSTAAMMAAIFSCFFSTLDNPAPPIKQFLLYTVLSIPISAFYLLVAIPAVHSFEMLAMIIFPSVFVLSALAIRPAWGLKAMALLFGVLGSFALMDQNAANLDTYLNSISGQLFGTWVAALVASLFRTISAERAIRRIQRANRRDLAMLASARPVALTPHLTSRMLDRVGLLQPRLTASVSPEQLTGPDSLLALRVGNDIAVLRTALPSLSLARNTASRMLGSLEQYFRRPRTAPDSALLQQLDQTLSEVLHSTISAGTRERAIVALVGLRRGLFPKVDGFPATTLPKEPQA